ncbi:MAG: hypothetical protein HYS22_03260 [Deltaproteobacteria bacterium]|nr:hypothetical protein [Deltaproteobacteria bacterium]
MRKQDWAIIRKRIGKVVHKGVAYLKEGTKQAGYVAGKTAHVVHLEMNIQTLKSKIAKLSKELGQVVHASWTNGHIRTTPESKKLHHHLHQLERNLKQQRQELVHTHITK